MVSEIKVGDRVMVVRNRWWRGETGTVEALAPNGAGAYIRCDHKLYQGKVIEKWFSREELEPIPDPAPLTPEEAQAAYDAAPAVPLSKERIEEIVRYATKKHPGPAPSVGF